MILRLSPDLSARFARLYEDMECSYDEVAALIGLTCTGCPDNCCDSYFMHHTYIEWGYLWEGLNELPPEKQQEILRRAQQYEQECISAGQRGERPQAMCPLNEGGRCMLYKHRLMVCRTHGVTASMTRPDGQKLEFPGCFRCQEILEEEGNDRPAAPVMDRTDLLRRLVLLEQEFLQSKHHVLPRVKMTIAGMLVSGPPSVPHCSDAQS